MKLTLYIVHKKDEGYIQQTSDGKLVITNNKTLSSKFTYDKAVSFVNNCIAPSKRELYSVKEVKSEKDRLYEVINPLINSNFHFDEASNMLVLSSENDSEDKQHIPAFNMSNFDWVGTCTYFSNFFAMLPKYRESLNSQFKEIENKKIDIEHYIEFNQLNARDGYKAYKLMYDIRQKRRFVKDEIQKVDILLDSTLSDLTGDKVVTKLNGLNNRKYRPRSLYKLFPNYSSD